jgi:hypothetical protein
MATHAIMRTYVLHERTFDVKHHAWRHVHAPDDLPPRPDLRGRPDSHADGRGVLRIGKERDRGVYHGVSTRWLQGYLNEYAWRYNRRGDRNTMFRDLLDAAATTPLR